MGMTDICSARRFGPLRGSHFWRTPYSSGDEVILPVALDRIVGEIRYRLPYVIVSPPGRWPVRLNQIAVAMSLEIERWLLPTFIDGALVSPSCGILVIGANEIPEVPNEDAAIPEVISRANSPRVLIEDWLSASNIRMGPPVGPI